MTALKAVGVKASTPEVRLLTRVAATLIAFWCFCWLCQTSSAASKVSSGVALVIGEANYRQLRSLQNPANDAASIAGLLTKLGFEVVTVLDFDAARLRRKLRSFISEAEGNDVALIYYSGHGIEADGKNYLVPVDAELMALDEPEKALIEIAPMLDQLKQKVPISIMILDACRTSPFPSGSRLAVSAEELQPISATGLSNRGFIDRGVETAERMADRDRAGDVIAFAAAPGEAALDGPSGENSPYVKAILKHLAVTDAYEFNQIMAMVTGEVYLTTQGQQQPWTNASLRKILVFGGSPPEDGLSVERAIRASRRQLLLQVADTPKEVQDILREQATKRKLSLAWLYDARRSLKESGKSATFEALEDELDRQAEVIAQFQGRHDAEGNPRLGELLHLAGLAIDEGALPVARKIMDEAITLTVPLAELKERELAARRQNAIAFEARGEVSARSSRYREAADDFGKARQYMLDVDPAAARKYRFLEADMLRSDGEFFGTAGSFADAALIYAELRQELAQSDMLGWSIATNRLANVEAMIGKRGADAAKVKHAISLYSEALARIDRATLPAEWAKAHNNIGGALLLAWDIGRAGSAPEEAMAHFRSALEIWTREEYPEDWARAHHNLGKALTAAGLARSDPDLLQKAVAEFNLALEGRSGKAANLDWAASMNGLASAYKSLGDITKNAQRYDEAASSYDLAARRIDKRTSPLAWATNRYNVGLAHLARYQLSGRQDDIRQALAAWIAALEARPENLDGAGWAQTVAALADGYLSLAQETGEERDAVQALDYVQKAKRSALARTSRAFWATVRNTEGDAYTALYEIRELQASQALLDDAVLSYQDSMKTFLELGDQARESVVELSLAYAEHLIAQRLRSRQRGENALKRAEKALSGIRATGAPAEWQLNLRNEIERGCGCRP